MVNFALQRGIRAFSRDVDIHPRDEDATEQRSTIGRLFQSKHVQTLSATPYGAVLNGFELQRNGVLRFGRHAVPLAAVRRYAPVHHRDRDINSTLATVALFVGAASFMLILVVEMGWRARFLVATLLFTSVAVAAITDLSRTFRLNIYRLEIELDGGERVMFVTPDQVLLARMMQTIQEKTGIAPARHRQAQSQN